MVKDIEKVKKEMSDFGKDGMELHYTEFNCSPSSRDLMYDSYHNATYILNTLRQSHENVTSMSYWTFTDIFEEAGPVIDALHGGFGLLNWHGIRKPTFYAYSFLNKLYTKELSNSDRSSWVTKDEKGNYAALIYDFTMPQYSNKDTNNSFFIKQQPDESKGKIKFQIDGIEKGNYILYLYKVGYMNGDVNSVYINMGRPSQLSITQEEALSEISNIKPEVSVIELTEETFNMELDWRSNMMYFIKLLQQ